MYRSHRAFRAASNRAETVQWQRNAEPRRVCPVAGAMCHCFAQVGSRHGAAMTSQQPRVPCRPIPVSGEPSACALPFSPAQRPRGYYPALTAAQAVLRFSNNAASCAARHSPPPARLVGPDEAPRSRDLPPRDSRHRRSSPQARPRWARRPPNSSECLLLHLTRVSLRPRSTGA